MGKEKNLQEQNFIRLMTFTVPSSFGEIRKNINLLSNTPIKPFKEEIINKAIILHLKGKTYEAAKSTRKAILIRPDFYEAY